MIIHEIHDLSNQYVTKLLQSGLSLITDKKIIKNYHPDYYQESCNLFYILKKGRYNQYGKYFVLEENNQYIASAGWNQYEYNPDIALLLTRMFVLPKYRNNYILGNTVLPKMIEETKKYNKRWMTVNEYNKKIYDWFVTVTLKKNHKFSYWADIYKNFYPIGLKNIYFTDQLVLEYKNDK